MRTRMLSVGHAVLLFLLCGQIAYAQDQPAFKLIWPENMEALDTTFALKIHASLPKFVFRIQANNSAGVLTVMSERNGANDTANVIGLYSKEYPVRSLPGNALLICDDFDFDGFMDFATMNDSHDRFENPYYSVWLFDNRLRRYAENEAFSQAVSWNYTLDKKARTVTSTQVDEFFTQCYETTTYRLVNKKLQAIRIESVDRILASDSTSDIQLRWTLKRLVRNRMTLVKDTIFQTSEELQRFLKK